MDPMEMQALSERAKELECVYAVDEVLQDRALAIPDAMHRLTRIIPTGFSNPGACRIRIELWGDSYETPGFCDAEIIYSAAVMMEDEPVGAVTAGYVASLLKEECRLLQYEVKLMDTISRRVSQLALGRRRDLTLLLNLLRQVDPDMLLRIEEKLKVYIEQTVGSEASALFRELGASHGPTYGEANAPMAAGPSVNAELLARKLIEGATAFLPQDTLFGLLNDWMFEQRILAFVKTVDQKDSTISDILDAVRKYTGARMDMPGDENQYSQIETWLISELTHRFLSDDERLINLVLDSMRIQDFAPMIEHIVGSERTVGNIGGKGAGIFIASQILRHAARDDPLLADIKIPRSWYIAADHSVDFMHFNDLEELNSYKYNSMFHLRMTYNNIVTKVKNARLPPQTMNMLRVVLTDLADTPIIVRSSSLLEDKHSGTFSGKYKSLFLSNRGTFQERLDALADAVLEVYSSVNNPDAIQYRKERGLLHFSEQIGIIIQEVVGKTIGPYFMPLFSGVAFSDNLLRWSPRITREDGLVRLVMGLGTRAVDRVSNDYPVMFAPGQPQLRINQTPSDVFHYSPKQIDLIHLKTGRFDTVDAASFLKEMGGEIPKLYQMVSVYTHDFMETKNAFSLNPKQDNMVITFDNILNHTDIPSKLKRMMEVLSEKLRCPVDIEFAYDGEHIYLVQCRPQGTGLMSAPAPIPQNISRQDIVFTANRFVTDGLLQDLSYIVYVDGDAYNALSTREELLAVGEAVGLLNDALPRRNYILMGPGRWGSRGDIKLGVRVTYSDISNTAALIEIAKEKHAYVPELSFGTHFFQDLVESGIVYLPLYPGQRDVVFRDGYFQSCPNLLGKLLPQFQRLSDVIKVIDVPASSAGRTLSLHMNSQLGQAVAFLSHRNEPAAGQGEPPQAAAWSNWSLESEQEHWQWRHYMAQQIAQSMDMERYGVKGIYLFGSTNTGSTGMGSDIDLILHCETEEKIAELRLWLDGWSRALARINFLQTGHDADLLLDIHVVTDEDVRAGNSFAIKMTSAVDPAAPLRLR